MRIRAALAYLMIPALMSVVLPSCKDDDPPTKAKLSIPNSTMEVKESDGVITVDVTLDKPASEDLTIEYSLDGTAQDNETATQNTDFPDYEIVGDHGEVKILKGETTGTIEIELYSDFEIDENEKIDLKLTTVSGNSVEIMREDEITITIKQEDGMIVNLSWPAPTTPTDGADMDLLVRIGANTTNWADFVALSLRETYQSPEQIFLPSAIKNVYYGLCYTYYDGTLDPLPFKVTFAKVINGALEAESQWQTFEKSYTAVNKNKYTNITTVKVVQSIQNIDGAFNNFSSITVPDTGSRIISPDESPTTIKKSDRKYFSKSYRSGTILDKLK
jgi:hypothetical protein